MQRLLRLEAAQAIQGRTNVPIRLAKTGSFCHLFHYRVSGENLRIECLPEAISVHLELGNCKGGYIKAKQ